jgi:Zn-finger nucleic acid-binding protein
VKCPRCPDATLDERAREGITIDACPTCRGVWLDRGELERLIALATAELDQEPERDLAPERPGEAAPERPREDAYRRDPRDYERRRDHDRPDFSSYDRDRDRHGWYRSRDHDDDDDRRYGGRYRHPRKKRWFEILGDVFD